MNKKLLEYFNGDELEKWDMEILPPLNRDHKNRAWVMVKCKVCNLYRKVYISALRNKKGIWHGMACTYAIKHKDAKYNRLSKIYTSLKQRVENPNHINFNSYGGRGIKNEFKSFIDFYLAMGDSYRELYDINNGDIELDRIDNNGNYSQSNCRWVTHKVNSNNRNPSKSQKEFQVIENGIVLYIYNNQHECSREHNLDVRRINRCLKNPNRLYNNWKFKYI